MNKNQIKFLTTFFTGSQNHTRKAICYLYQRHRSTYLGIGKNTSYEQHWLKQAQKLLNGSKRQKPCSSINKYVTTLLHMYICYDKNNYLQ